MSNIDKWRLFLKDLVSPDSYIDWGWYYTVAAALQRRVWLGAQQLPIYPNLYVVFVGSAGVGKSLVVDRVSEILRHHQYKPVKRINGVDLYEAEVSAIENKGYVDADILETAMSIAGKKEKNTPPRTLFPVASNATTYEALVRSLALSTRYTESKDTKMYVHCSLCFALSELGSLFRKHTEDVVTLLQQTYDCGDYEYDTKTQGKDVIRQCCVSLIAGTTPSFMQRVFTDELLTEGIASRTIFVYEMQNRFHKPFIPCFTPEQMSAKKDLLEHIKILGNLYGEIKLEPGLIDFVENWWVGEATGTSRVNKSQRLDHYYARKNLHTLKTAIAIHFSESTEMILTIKDVEKAILELTKIEAKMHFAVTLDNKNPLAGVAKNILSYLTKYGPQTKKDLFAEFYGSTENGITGLEEVIKLLSELEKISQIKEDGQYKFIVTKAQS